MKIKPPSLKKSRTVINAFWLTAILLFVVWFIVGYKYGLIYTKGESMSPAYSDGEWVVIEKINFPPNWIPDRFDVIVIEDEVSGENLCKRIIGVPGDTIEIKDGFIYLNDKLLKDSFGYGRIISEEIGETIDYINQEKFTVSEGLVWIIGDNRRLSVFRQLPIKDIKGLVIL